VQLAEQPAAGMRTILFVDEIYWFNNKAQQDAFLYCIAEVGTAVLILSHHRRTLSLEAITPVGVCLRVLVLEPLDALLLSPSCQAAARELKLSAKTGPRSRLIYRRELSAGDARIALGNLELAMEPANGRSTRPSRPRR